jgi:aspartyl-tRNA(Asn)/glutamyl-tRNA(Gln) amidotransferase subunit A
MRLTPPERNAKPGGPTLGDLAHSLAAGRTTARALVEDCLARIEDTSGEGARAYISVSGERARAAADAMDRLRSARAEPSPYAGIPISIKDLFDVAGEVTCAGSRVLAGAPPARADAPAVARLRRAGFILIGRANMTEFAYSGLGLNPHYGTPLNPWDRTSRRAPGGSTSGGAVAVADGMAHATLGTDTGGSCRIPAAFMGLVGYKPTAHRIPLAGAVPLAPSLDSVGPIARSVRCCAVLDALLAAEPEPVMEEIPLAGLRLAVPQTVALDSLDEDVARTFEEALRRLSKAGASIEEAVLAEFGRIAPMSSKGGFPAAESYAWHRNLVEREGHCYDPRVASRILRGREQSASDYIELLAARRALIEDVGLSLARFDALVLPTVAIVPPRIDDLASDEAYSRINLLALRNTTLINMIDGCAVSVPIHEPGAAPVGLMIAGPQGHDRRVLAIAAGVERALGADASSPTRRKAPTKGTSAAASEAL